MNSISQFSVKLFNNIDTLSKGIGFELSMVLVALFSTMGSACVALIINWKLTLVILCTVPLTIAGSYVFSELTAKESRNELDMYSKAGEVVQEVFSSLRTVLSLNGEKVEEKRYESKLKATRWSSIRKGAAFGLLAGWIYLIGYIIYSVGFAFGSSLMHQEGHKKLSFSDLLVIVVTLARLITNIAFVSPFFQLLEEARGALMPVFRLIDEEEKTSINETQIFQDSVACEEAINMNGDIQFDNIKFAYPARPDVLVLQNLNLTARAGEITALVGSNGSGKSTCVSLLLRFYEPLSGHITINDRSIADCNFKQLRQKIGVVSQEPILFATSIYENIRFGKANATRIEIEEAARQANVHDFIMGLPNKYDTIVGEHGIQLSGGEKQRVALARAFVKQPVLLLLDEATSALDNTNEKIVQEALDRACKGRTTIVIAHRLSAIQNAHRIYVLHNGRVIEQGTHDILMSKEESQYHKMMKAQQRRTTEINIDETSSFTEIDDDDKSKISEHSRHPSDTEFNEKNKYTAFAVSGAKLTRRLCTKAFAHYLRQEMAFFDHVENTSGAICNRLSSDALAIQQMVGSRLGVVFESVAMFGIGIILGLLFSWQLTLIMLFFIISLFILSFMQIWWQARLNKRSDYFLGLASSLAVDIIHNMRTVKQLASETEFLHQFSNLVLKEFKFRRNDIIISSLLESIYWGTGPFLLFVLGWQAVNLVEHKELKMNNLSIVFAYYIFALESLRCTMTSTRQMSESLSAARSFFNLFDRISAIDNSPMGGQQLSDFKGEIEFDQVKFAYASRPTSYILNKFQLIIKPGQRVALIGASGCGKSTVIHLLERFYDPIKGRISFDGVDIRQLNIQWLRSCLGLVSQEPILFDLTIAQNIAYGRENTSIEDIIDAAIKANIHDFIQQLPQGYETKVGKKGGHLSGGEKQRIALARVLLCQPKILLLDEATSAMDSYNEQ
ncbi:unnamed protein product, partial [Rotaria sordida]